MDTGETSTFTSPDTAVIPSTSLVMDNPAPDISQTPISATTRPKDAEGRSFRCAWIDKYHWIDYVENENKVYCSTCRECDTMQLFKFATKREKAFTTVGFSSWKHATESFQAHEESLAHKESVLKVAAAVRGTNISSQINTMNSRNMELARSALLKIVSSLQYLARQGLAIRGHVDSESNFKRLLHLRSDDSSELQAWVKRSSYTWTSPDIQNELIEIMALSVLRNIMQTLKTDKYYSVMVDETTDISVTEQVSFCFRHVDSSLQVNETFAGFHSTSLTNATTLFTILKDIVLRFDVGLDKCRGQCYDGASNMSGKLSGVQAQLSAINPKAVYVHCANHCLNLMFQDALSQITVCRDAMNSAKDMINFVRNSPKRYACFSSLQPDDNASLRPLCPTRWTMRVSSVQTLVENYESLLTFMAEVSDCHTNETGTKAGAFLKSLRSFDTFFGFNLLIEIFGRCETVAAQLQSTSLSVTECQRLITGLRLCWKQQREEFIQQETEEHTGGIGFHAQCESRYDRFWDSVTREAERLELDEPELPRVRRPPKRFDGGSTPHIFKCPKDRFRQIYIQALDECLGAIDSRFNSEAFKVANNIEKVVVDAAEGRAFELSDISQHFGDDLDKRRLELHLSMLSDLITSKGSKKSGQRGERRLGITDVIKLFKTNHTWRTLLPEVMTLLTLYLCIPVTSCTAERSFSSLRRLKTYLRSTMSQERLNHVAILHSHKDLTDQLDLEAVCNDFVQRNDMRRKVFALFPVRLIN